MLKRNDKFIKSNSMYFSVILHKYFVQIPSKGDPLKAVIVNIHPGAFFHGSPDPNYYGSPDYVMNHDVVFVHVGYRLHILGKSMQIVRCYHQKLMN